MNERMRYLSNDKPTMVNISCCFVSSIFSGFKHLVTIDAGIEFQIVHCQLAKLL